ncbi:NUDIX hydrolase [Corynebacterium kutscheri]|uniref:NUDIX family protein n=1 Tax=Corynebacterium kutscheri TaxID=35755 RepID=A0A0F6TCP1_9CORY|nr:NUDIX hydrolase [Corynebacterium kutscheri]AKE40991.1 NUDIX family protein [Corynebacterium kutscheri]VEH06868.1 NUDIX hydrolase [Corynebacterium kutscheri]VEH09289.1 NUDIX hydrolase [Corynebacterium kutscheri]VEH79377.1 NUDIX hydrolase [Corynebacterium kutscheri]
MSAMQPVQGLGGRKLAVTVLMIRDTAHGLEVYVQERVSSMPTFPNTTVFPGGGVDLRDFEEQYCSDGSVYNIWGKADVEQWANRLHTTNEYARGLIGGAVRELFEETGTLVAAHADGRLIDDATAYHKQRVALENHSLSLVQMLAENNLIIRSDLLFPFARWVSGVEENHHFDVYSLLAIQVPGQEPDGNNREVSSTGWFPPALILDGWRAGLLNLVLPTWAQLLQLSHYTCVAEVIADTPTFDLTPIIGTPVEDARYQEFFTHTPVRRF